MYALGADHCILLSEKMNEMETSFQAEYKEGIDIVLDYLWGPSALCLIHLAAKNRPLSKKIQFVQIGSNGGASIPYPSSALRSSGLRLMGSGLGSLTIT